MEMNKRQVQLPQLPFYLVVLQVIIQNLKQTKTYQKNLEKFVKIKVHITTLKKYLRKMKLNQ